MTTFDYATMSALYAAKAVLTLPTSVVALVITIFGPATPISFTHPVYKAVKSVNAPVSDL